mgnify:CR=1 FL=1
METNYYQKYLKYKNKYLQLKAQLEGGKPIQDQYGNYYVDFEDKGLFGTTKKYVFLIEDNENSVPKYSIRFEHNDGSLSIYDIQANNIKKEGGNFIVTYTSENAKEKKYNGTYTFNTDKFKNITEEKRASHCRNRNPNCPSTYNRNPDIDTNLPFIKKYYLIDHSRTY